MIRRALGSLRFRREHHWTMSHMSEYLDHHLDEPGRERVEEHAGLCPQCRRVLATLRSTVSGLRALGEPPGPSAGGVAEGVLGRFREEDG
jgi:anti-sigma factor RsiW